MSRKKDFIDEWTSENSTYSKKLRRKFIRQLNKVIDEESLWNYTVLHRRVISEIRKASDILHKVIEVKK